MFLKIFEGGFHMENLSSKLSKAVRDLAVAVADVTVNSSCHWHYYQEKMDDQLDSLKRYQDDEE
jgi:cyclic lactone autoinducer peptide